MNSKVMLIFIIIMLPKISSIFSELQIKCCSCLPITCKTRWPLSLLRVIMAHICSLIGKCADMPVTMPKCQQMQRSAITLALCHRMSQVIVLIVRSVCVLFSTNPFMCDTSLHKKTSKKKSSPCRDGSMHECTG